MSKRLVHVRWEDASYSHGYIRSGEETESMIIETVGFVVSRNKKMLRVGMQWSEDNDEFRHVTNIPIKYIKRVRRLG